MRFLSVCSGIEAASVAWDSLGWRAWSFAEIDQHAATVLRHRFPKVPNLGDMTKYERWPDGRLDLLCGGTPCQSFSLAGLRKGMDDPRGNLMLTFGAIARRYLPRWLVWENVPGVLSSNGGRDFGAFLGMLGQLGYGFAYRVLDARYFGLAQRRERVFVVAYLGAWQPAAAVLFERDSLLRNPSQGADPGSGDTGPVAPCVDATGVGAGQSLLTRTREVADALSARRRHELIGFSQRGLKDNGSWQEDLAPSLQCEAPVVLSGFAGFASKAKASNVVTPTLASASAGSMIVGGARAFNHRRTVTNVKDDGQCVVANTLTVCSPGGAVYGFSRHQTVDASKGLSPTQTQGTGAPMISDDEDLRKMTPIECERLQGFEDGWTAVPTGRRNKSMEDPTYYAYQAQALAHLGYTHAELMTIMPDGARYKMIGNSWAVPVARWVGQRIQEIDDVLAPTRPARQRKVLT